MIRHFVILKLKNTINADEKQAFFADVDKLAAIPGVQKFEVLKQISPKNTFEFGISMKFETQEQYKAYSNHLDHTTFFEHFWLKM